MKAETKLPVIANGDITTPEEARAVLTRTAADGIMIGRGAQGRPWIFREISHYLATGTLLAPPTIAEIEVVLVQHLQALHDFYGPELGVRFARKHVSWYTKTLRGAETFRERFNRLTSAEEQLEAIATFFMEYEECVGRLFRKEEKLAA